MIAGSEESQKGAAFAAPFAVPHPFLEDPKANKEKNDIDRDSKEGGQDALLRKEHHGHDRGEKEKGHPESDPDQNRIIPHRNAP